MRNVDYYANSVEFNYQISDAVSKLYDAMTPIYDTYYTVSVTTCVKLSQLIKAVGIMGNYRGSPTH